MKRTVLTAKANPWNPFENFKDWKRWEDDHKTYSYNVQARIAHTSGELTDEENELIIEAAIDSFLRNDFLGTYKKLQSEE